MVEELRARRHRVAVIDPRYTTEGQKPFASPLAITRGPDGLRRGVDTFHTAHAAGL